MNLVISVLNTASIRQGDINLFRLVIFSCPKDRIWKAYNTPKRPYFVCFTLYLGLLKSHVLPRTTILMIETSTSISGRSSLFPFEDAFLEDSHGDQALSSGLSSPTRCQNGERVERYSRKVFVGGLPPDIDEGTMHSLMIFPRLGLFCMSFGLILSSKSTVVHFNLSM